MPKVGKEAPDSLRPYLFHGLDLNWPVGIDQAVGDCPWCNKEQKFFVSLKTGQWDCKTCDPEGGNAVTFMRRLWQESDTATNSYDSIRKLKSLATDDALINWEVAKSVTTHNWLIPGYNIKGEITQLYKFVKKLNKLFPTPTFKHAMMGMSVFDPARQDVYLTEGPWDGMALWETLARTKENPNGDVSVTSNQKISLLAVSNVLAVPGCNSFDTGWCSVFSEKDVAILFDNDHEKKHSKTNRPLKQGGYYGVQRIAKMLQEYHSPPNSVSYIEWGKNGYDKGLPDGYDVRDLLTA